MQSTFLDNAAIAKKAPAVFTKEPAHFLSSAYSFINTGEVIDVMRGEGYHVVSASQDKPSRRDLRYVRHAVALRHESALASPAVVGEYVPQILLINSHNGRTQLSFRAGLYRFVCCNGLVIGHDNMVFAIRHSHQLASAVVDITRRIAAQTAQVQALIDRWKAIELTDSAMHDFATSAAKLRFGDRGANTYPSDNLLRVMRPEDDGRTLWAVFNRVQEHTTNPGLQGRSANGRLVTSRRLEGITSVVNYNQALWRLAESYAPQQPELFVQ